MKTMVLSFVLILMTLSSSSGNTPTPEQQPNKAVLNYTLATKIFKDMVSGITAFMYKPIGGTNRDGKAVNNTQGEGERMVKQLEEELDAIDAKNKLARKQFFSKLNGVLKELKTKERSRTFTVRIMKIATDFARKMGEILRNNNSLSTISIEDSEIGVLLHRSHGSVNRTILAEDISKRISLSIDSTYSKAIGSRFLAKAFLPSDIIQRNGDDIIYAIGYRDPNVFDSSSSCITSIVLYLGLKHHSNTSTRLSSPISLLFRKDIHKTGQKSCVSWNFSRNVWDSRGCMKVGETNEGIITCRCNHLANFGVLINVSQTDYSTEFLPVHVYISGSISIVGLVAVIFLHTVAADRYVRDRVRSKILVRLCVSFILLLALFVTLIKNTSGEPDDYGCRIKGGCLHYFLLVAFMCMGTEAWEQNRRMLRDHESNVEDSRFLYGSLVVTLILPLIVVTASGIKFYEYYGSESHCFVRGVPFYAFVLAPIVTVVIFSVRVITNARIVLFRMGSNEKVTTEWKFVCGKVALFGVTWIVGAPGVGDLALVFQTLFTVLNTLQGLFIFLIVLLEKKNREELIYNSRCCCGRFSGSGSRSGGNQHEEDMIHGSDELIPMPSCATGNKSGNRGQGRWNEVLGYEFISKLCNIKKKKNRAAGYEHLVTST